MVDFRKEYHISSPLNFMEKAFRGRADLDKGRFYCDFDGDGVTTNEEWIAIPLDKEDHFDTDEFYRRMGKGFSPKREHYSGPVISAENKPGMTPSEYRKLIGGSPVERFTAGAGGEIKNEAVSTVDGTSELYKICSKGVREKTGLKYGATFAALTSACMAGGILEGVISYVISGELFGDIKTAASDISSGDAKRAGKGTTRIAIIGLQLYGASRLPKLKIGISEPPALPIYTNGMGSTALATAGGGTLSISSLKSLGHFALSAGTTGKYRKKVPDPERRMGEEDLAKKLEKYKGNLSEAARDPGIPYKASSLRRMVNSAKPGDPLFRIKEARSTVSRGKSLARLAKILEDYGSDFLDAARDPEVMRQAKAILQELTDSAKPKGSLPGLAKKKAAAKTPIAEAKPPVAKTKPAIQVVDGKPAELISCKPLKARPKALLVEDSVSRPKTRPEPKLKPRTNGAEFSDEFLAKKLEEHGGDIGLTANDPEVRMYNHELVDRINSGGPESPLTARRKRTRVHVNDSDYPQIDPLYLATKLEEHAWKGNPTGILTDPTVELASARSVLTALDSARPGTPLYYCRCLRKYFRRLLPQGK